MSFPELKVKPELEKCLPPLSTIEYQKLKASIGAGYDPAKPIVLWQEYPDTIVDGHHRYKICQELRVVPSTVTKSFDTLQDAVLYTLRRQTEQRNMTAAQLVIVQERIMDIEAMKREASEQQSIAGGDRKSEEYKKSLSAHGPESDSSKPSQEVAKKIAKAAGVNESTVYGVHAIQKEGTPELVALVESGDVGIKAAKDFVKNIPDKQQQKAILDKSGAKGVNEHQRELRKKQAARRAEAKEIEKFKAFDKTVAEKSAKSHKTLDALKSIANGGCLLPNLSELFCEDCQWGFDVYLPYPSDPRCPYCCGKNVIKRDPEWNSRGV